MTIYLYYLNIITVEEFGNTDKTKNHYVLNTQQNKLQEYIS